MDEKRIMVVNTDRLFGKYRGRRFEGFQPIGKYNFPKLIRDNYTWMKRSEAEINFSFKQPIPYVVILNTKTSKIFAYRRAPKSNEARLKGKRSIGIGGHVELHDRKDSNPVFAAMLRELREEVLLDYKDCHLLGFINVDNDDVGKVHFGLCYLIETESDVQICDKALQEGSMMTLEEIEDNIDDFELWSKTAFTEIRQLLE